MQLITMLSIKLLINPISLQNLYAENENTLELRENICEATTVKQNIVFNVCQGNNGVTYLFKWELEKC